MFCSFVLLFFCSSFFAFTSSLSRGKRDLTFAPQHGLPLCATILFEQRQQHTHHGVSNGAPFPHLPYILRAGASAAVRAKPVGPQTRGKPRLVSIMLRNACCAPYLLIKIHIIAHLIMCSPHVTGCGNRLRYSARFSCVLSN